MPNKHYLGDGAYAEFDGYSIWLTTENGIETTNRVCLEPAVIDAFLKILPNYYNFSADALCKALNGQK